MLSATATIVRIITSPAVYLSGDIYIFKLLPEHHSFTLHAHILSGQRLINA